MTDLFRNIVPVAFIEVIRDRLAKFARRCEKKGMPVPALNLGEKSMRCLSEHLHEADGAGCAMTEMQEVWMSGETPRIGPWSLVASIDNVEGKPFFRPVPGQEVPVRFRGNDPTTCEYCNVRNPRRTETFIVHNADTDEFKQVGRQCIRDFLGWNIDTLVRWYEYVASMGEEPEGGWGGYARPSWKPEEVIRYAANVVSVDGVYKKAFENDNDSTKSKVWEFLSPPRNASEQRWYQDFLTKYNSQPELAERIFQATVSALATLGTSSDWAYNVTTATSAEYVGARQVGIVASAVILGLRAIEADGERVRQEKAGVRPSEYIGEVGGKVDTVVTIIDARYFASNYGGSYLFTMTDDDGNSIKWFASTLPDVARGEWASYDRMYNPKTGIRVRIRGTVKKHEEYKGKKSTMLTRCKMEAI